MFNRYGDVLEFTDKAPFYLEEFQNGKVSAFRMIEGISLKVDGKYGISPKQGLESVLIKDLDIEEIPFGIPILVEVREGEKEIEKILLSAEKIALTVGAYAFSLFQYEGSQDFRFFGKHKLTNTEYYVAIPRLFKKIKQK